MFLSDNSTQKTFRITNPLKSGTLTWQIGDPVYHQDDKDWIASISPASGYTTREADKITVTVNRAVDLKPGLYSATLPIKSNAGSRIITVIMRVQEGPLLNVRPFMLIYLNREEVEKPFTITNGKSGTLNWEVGVPVYSGRQGWITSISSASGTTTLEEEADVFIKVSREGLSGGVYRASIPVTSNGGSKNVNVFLFVPFF
jgi:hypothetical protein